MSAWVLLRGLTRESRHWAQLPATLHASGIDDAVVLADLPGSGRYVRDRAPANVAATVDFLRARLHDAGPAPPYRIIALSLGAMVAVDWAQRFPDEIEALVLVNTSMRRYSRSAERLRPEAWLPLARAAWRWNSPARASRRRDVEAIIHTLTCARTDTRAEDLAVWTAIFECAAPTRFNALRQLCAAARFRGAPLAPRCPTLVLASRADALVHPACSAKLAAAWGAVLVEHPWAGHDLPHDDPIWLADTVCAWAGNISAVVAPPTSA